MLIEWASFVVIGVALLMICAGLGSTPRLRLIRNLLIAGVFMRILGVFARYSMIYNLYDGSADAVIYFQAGRVLADHFRALDFSVIGTREREWGTQAIRYASGFVLAVIGPSVRGAFLVFSSAAFAGLICMAVAFGRACKSPGAMRQAALLLFLWPTLWFWPSSIGKEAVLILAVGLVTIGYVGRHERIRWMPTILGFALVLAVRPHLAGVLAVATCWAEWTSRTWTPGRLLQSVVMSAVSLWLLVTAFGMLNLPDIEAAEQLLRDTAEHTNQGGSAINSGGGYATAIPMAFVNILFRPFITDVTSVTTLVSSLEMMTLWALVFRNRRRVWSSLRSWQQNRLLRLAIPFTFLYVLMIGLTFQNVGIIARQRALVMPMLLLMFVAAPGASGVRAQSVRRSQPRRRMWGNDAGRSLAPAGAPS
jgi:hypothetical protein